MLYACAGGLDDPSQVALAGVTTSSVRERKNLGVFFEKRAIDSQTAVPTIL